jgi:thiamine-monophosphate kinase
VGEFAFLALLADRLPPTPRATVGPGDDAAELRLEGSRVLVATDVLVDGRHFRRDWAGPEDIGRRAAAQSLSDLNAMGGRASAITVGLTAPPDLEVAWALAMAEGMAAECALVGAGVVGGDLTRGDLLVIPVTAVGEVPGQPLLRSGARPGDLLAVRGRQGWAAAGLAVLARGFRSPRAVVEAYRRPEVPYDAGPEAARLGATAAIDVSDGLLADVGHVAEASRVAIDLDSSAFTLDEPLAAVGAALGVDPLTFVLGGGDDHCLVASFPPDTALPEGWVVVGRVGAGEGVTVDGSPYAGERGHVHF